MKKRGVIVNSIPLGVWGLVGIYAPIGYYAEFEFDIGLIVLLLPILFPLLYGIYNFIVIKEVYPLAQLYGISFLAQLLGMSVFFTVYSLCIYDPEAGPVMSLFLGVMIACCILLYGLGLGIKAIICSVRNKKGKNI